MFSIYEWFSANCTQLVFSILVQVCTIIFCWKKKNITNNLIVSIEMCSNINCFVFDISGILNIYFEKVLYDKDMLR